jgi:RNA polymerase sigma-70 factor (ECF subfamily)
VVEENTDFVASIVKKFVKDPETIKDLTQEIFLKAYLNYQNYYEDGKIRAWLAVIANNMLKNHYKAENYQNSHLIFSPIEDISDKLLSYANIPENIVAEKDFMDGIIKIINSLSQNQRDTIIYSYFYNYSDKEIASLKNISLSAVKSAKHFGLKKVKELVSSNYNYAGLNEQSAQYKPNKKFGRYRMIKCYLYDGGKLSEHTELIRDSVIELTAPSQSDITDVAKFLNISEEHVQALVDGDFDTLHKNDYNVSFRLNETSNVMFFSNPRLAYMIICHDKPYKSAQDFANMIQILWGLTMSPGYINLDFEDFSMILAGAKKAYFATGYGKGAEKSEAGLKALTPEILKIVNQSKGMIVSMTVSADLRLDDIDQIMSKIHNSVAKDCVIIFGVNFVEELTDEVIVSVLTSDKTVVK